MSVGNQLVEDTRQYDELNKDKIDAMNGMDFTNYFKSLCNKARDSGSIELAQIAAKYIDPEYSSRNDACGKDSYFYILATSGFPGVAAHGVIKGIDLTHKYAEHFYLKLHDIFGESLSDIIRSCCRDEIPWADKEVIGKDMGEKLKEYVLQFRQKHYGSWDSDYRIETEPDTA